MYNNRLIFKTSNSDEVYYLKDSIFVKFNVNRNSISNSVINGGVKNNLKYIFNKHLSQKDINYLENHDLNKYLIRYCKNLGFDSNLSSGLVTLALMKNVSIVIKSYKNIEVTAITTAGVRVNATQAGDVASYYEENNKFYAGTINTLLLINSKLPQYSLIEAFMTAVEAKTVALNNLKIPSQYSNGFATGTGTDGLIIASNLDSGNVLTNAGKHSKLGELIAKSIIESIYVAVKKQVWITSKSQSNVLVLLNRYKLDINRFYDSLNEDKRNFIEHLIPACKNQENVAVTLSILNLFDDAERDIVDKKVAYDIAIILLDSCKSQYIKKLLRYWIVYFLG